MKLILPALARLKKGEVVNGTWLNGSFSYNIILKSSGKLLLLEFKLKTVENGNTYLNTICFLYSYNFFQRSLSQLVQVQKSDDFNTSPLIKKRFPDDEICNRLRVRTYNPTRAVTLPRG